MQINSINSKPSFGYAIHPKVEQTMLKEYGLKAGAKLINKLKKYGNDSFVILDNRVFSWGEHIWDPGMIHDGYIGFLKGVQKYDYRNRYGILIRLGYRKLEFKDFVKAEKDIVECALGDALKKGEMLEVAEQFEKAHPHLTDFIRSYSGNDTLCKINKYNKESLSAKSSNAPWYKRILSHLKAIKNAQKLTREAINLEQKQSLEKLPPHELKETLASLPLKQ